ncbi:hypothetical protein NQ317_013509, partial [Molorchus minor]
MGRREDEIEKVIEEFNRVDDSVDIDESDLTPIQEFYKDATVLVTGCTGFLGHVLLEKLLRSCPVSRIYVLVRKKRGKELETRLDEMFTDKVFQRVADQRFKVVAIEGDCEGPNLGISGEDRDTLIKEVDMVFHVAATVRFDEKLKTAICINVRAVRDLLRLARQMPRLKSFVHVSTIYCNCTRDVIAEEIYPPVANYEGVISMVETLREEVLDKITPTLLGKYPNTYTYSKQIAEDVVKREGEGCLLQFTVQQLVRHFCSIVKSILPNKEPIRGWINNLYGPTGVVVGTGAGFIRVVHINNSITANVIPVDICVNSLLAVAWEAAENFKKAKEERSDFKLTTYNCESSTENVRHSDVRVSESNSADHLGIFHEAIVLHWGLRAVNQKHLVLQLHFGEELHLVGDLQ